MTTEELNTIVQAVMAELEKAGVDFDFKAETPQADDLVFVIRGTADNYQGLTVTWQNLLDIIVKKATDAKDEAVSAKDIALETLATIQGIESNVSSIKSSVETTKSQVETMKGDVSTMKTTVEASESNVTQMKVEAEQTLAETKQIVAGKVDKTYVDGELAKKADITYVDGKLATKADKSELAVERARIDSLSKLSEGSTTGDAELIDLRIGADGVTYGNAGTAVRTQISNLKGDLENHIDRTTPTELISLLTQQGSISTDGNEANKESLLASYHRSDYISVNKGDIIQYTNCRATNVPLIAVYSKSKVYDSENSLIGPGVVVSGTFTIPYSGYVRLVCRNKEINNGASFVITNSIGTKISKLNTDIETLNNRVQTLENENTKVIPSNWLTYLDTKKTDIKNSLVSIGDCGLSFTFATDCHIPRNNMLTPLIIKELNKECEVNYHINGGDFIDINTDSPQSALNVLWQWKNAMNGVVEYVLRGNHDSNNYNTSNADNALTIGQFYAIMNRQIEDKINTDGKTYFCIDNNSQKIRIICLDSSLSNKTDMYSWLQTKLTELDATWTILVIQHYLWASTTDTIHGNGQATINKINEVYSNINADFIGILAGHTHVDYNSTESVNGYNLIARDCNYGSGTDLESLSFDYVTINKTDKTMTFTKIGRGNDLVITY